jgi:hypothetical protein
MEKVGLYRLVLTEQESQAKDGSCTSNNKPRMTMKKPVLILLGCFCGAVMAQTPVNQQVISAGPATAYPNGAQSLMITNQAGGTFQIGELDSQLATLKTDVERTLPMLSAIVSQPGSPPMTRTRELENVASNFIAHAFGHETNYNGASPRMTNFAGFLHGLINTNAGGAGGVSFDPNTVSQLATLQNDLQQALSVLNNLNVTSTGGGTNGVPGAFRGLTPTGR